MSGGAFVLVIEGPDGAGKTTIAQQLEAEHDAVTWHNGVPDPDIPNLYRHYKQQIKVALQWRRVGKSVVIDRSFLSEYVYGAFRPAGSRLTKWQVHKLELFCILHRVTLLGVIADEGDRKMRIKLRGEKWRALYAWTANRYEDHFRQMSRTWNVVDTSETA